MLKETHMRIGADTIAVYESGGGRAEILFIHGNSANAEMFMPQLVGDFGNSYHVVALDLPGHGKSSAAAEPVNTYCLGGYASVVMEVVRRLKLTRLIVVGWSLGGHIALEIVQSLPDAAGFLIFGTPPLGIPPAMDRAFLSNPNFSAAFSPTLNEEQANIVANALFRSGEAAPPLFREALLKTDGRARQLLGASLNAMSYTDEVQIVANMRIPIAILHGSGDQFVNLEYLKNLSIPSLWRGGIQVIPDAGHALHWEQSERFNALLTEFASEVMDRQGTVVDAGVRSGTHD